MVNSNLYSNDADVRRQEIEKYFYEAPDEETLLKLVKLVEDPDKGVRNSLSILLTTLDNPSIPGLITGYVSSGNISVRNFVGDILLKNGNKSVKALSDYIDAGNNDDKKFVIDILGLIGNPEPAEKVIEVLKTNKDFNVILACLECLGNLKYEPAVRHITPFYKVNDLYKPTVIEALGKIGSGSVQDFLLHIYRSEDELTRYAIIESLGIIGNTNALGILISELKNADPFLVGPLVQSIFNIKSNFEAKILIDDKTANKIILLIDAIEKKYINAALNVVSNNPDIDLLPVYLKVFSINLELDERIKTFFADNLEEFILKVPDYLKRGNKNNVELFTFIKELIFVGNNQFEQLKLNGSLNTLIDELVEQMKSENDEVRTSACDLLFSVDEVRAIDSCDLIITDPNVWNRLNLLDNLSNLDPCKSESIIKQLAEDDEEIVRERAAFLLDQQLSN
ncbi:MAG: HEAT repeat domain-containing protein [Melioribacteraceae bacterium]|nr:HEAT repeat domain-containing protein [Melioribacteraceae bacterium]